MNTSLKTQTINSALVGCNNLQSGEICEAWQVCGLEYWTALTPTEQKQAGKIISEAVNNGELPLTKHERSPENHWRYKRK